MSTSRSRVLGGRTGAAAGVRHVEWEQRVIQFKQIALGRWELTVASDFTDAVLALDITRAADLEELCGGAESRAMGRGTNAILALPSQQRRLHLRPLRHGGLLARVTGKRLLGLQRPIDELEVTARLRDRGAPVPEPVMVLGRRTDFFWEAAVGSVHEEDSIDGLTFLSGRPGGARLRRGACAAGRAVRQLHDAGGLHADLHIKNLLIRESSNSAQVIVVDLDRAQIQDDVPAQRRMRELMRLYRSLKKRKLLDRLGRRGIAAFYASYLAGDRALDREMQRHHRREKIRVAAHALFYS